MGTHAVSGILVILLTSWHRKELLRQGLTIGDGVGEGHDADGQKRWNSLVDVVPVDLGRVDHHERAC